VAFPGYMQGLLLAVHGLTAREREVTELLIAGMDPNDAAARLNLSVHTVRSHIKAIFVKVAVSSRAELTPPPWPHANPAHAVMARSDSTSGAPGRAERRSARRSDHGEATQTACWHSLPSPHDVPSGTAV
jgi:DNA-binding CsgD family transcriptional regulator